MLIIGHRGASGTEPENTIRSFQKAVEVGADMVEMDVRESKDGEIVVFHDRDFFRLFGDPRKVSEMTLNEIKRVSAEHNREVPTLDEVVQTIGLDIIVEIKVHGIEAKVLSSLKNFPHKVMISSFYPKVLKKIRALDGNIQLGLAIGPGELHLIPVLNYLTRKINLSAINPRNTLVSLPSLILFRLPKRKVYVWTVNNEKEYKRMKSLKVDAIYTDYPELIREYEQGSRI